MPDIHPTAIIEEGATLHDTVQVGPYSIIEAGAVIGEGCVIESGVRIFGLIRLGKNNRVYHGATLGCEPQDLSFTPEKSTPLTFGDDNHIKEGVNFSRGVKTEAGSVVGNGNYFMCGFHAGHDIIFGDNNVFGPNSTIGGHAEVGDRAFISALVGIHQFCRVGDNAMLGGVLKIAKDVPPYTMVDGSPARVCGLNVVGLRRSDFRAEARSAIKRAYKVIYHSDLNTSQALAELKRGTMTPETEKIVRFFEQSERGVITHRTIKSKTKPAEAGPE
ncbi:acyl-ACP--UDP-N-acetylglucosamine O-acyltransferase [Solemya velesiana gill symbiont]|uniref:Acyl-[acyl-carrier-protein]--UDP-N-acetylglucosamine O-acyltransferase n=1 Tax=Solemya velesiana gill symbiont TaxID=1918948 RepID=A0A1T2KYH4_9GAMM|nr:acyl-ACP--UDP-N-acetylglucosamine O-acyltransferase [Solemya velesiana gill symbiont]OOZ37810.1 acyl-[acyl-carrier-protein]--UDP-N-acetylglucosamine O-acyltransferase [Solemya velesiana gill symbiont]